ncbi:MAG TPA: hypothetical protein VHS59_08615 [Bacillota bacterium]|nr:hypothetical protein [Bacillota bacterium]
MAQNKKGFWVLVVIFGLIALLGMFKAYIEGPNIAEHDATMGSTMGRMMAKEYEKQITIDSLLAPSENAAQVAAAAQLHNPAPIIKVISDFSTSSIYIMLPVLLGGVATLTVLWMGKEV